MRPFVLSVVKIALGVVAGVLLLGLLAVAVFTFGAVLWAVANR